MTDDTQNRQYEMNSRDDGSKCYKENVAKEKTMKGGWGGEEDQAYTYQKGSFVVCLHILCALSAFFGKMKEGPK